MRSVRKHNYSLAASFYIYADPNGPAEYNSLRAIEHNLQLVKDFLRDSDYTNAELAWIKMLELIGNVPEQYHTKLWCILKEMEAILDGMSVMNCLNLYAGLITLYGRIGYVKTQSELESKLGIRLDVSRVAS
ncbi:MAG: hypothetical protein IPG59_23165 [Candidatus Melainabacteria bacterium]|nr:MAG: hypothetical protein IPG59_23165 [Candidatus Melainabacteria bacterium]